MRCTAPVESKQWTDGTHLPPYACDSGQVLGLKSGATMAEIKKAHRKLALQNHPDKGGSDDKFREIQEAFETLQKVNGAKQNRQKFREAPK